jgi:hypothetical protein
MNESNQLNAPAALISWNKEESTQREPGQAKRQEVRGGKRKVDSGRKSTQVINFIAGQ